MDNQRLTVSDLKNFRFGGNERTFSSIVDKGINIDLEEKEKNSEILYGKFPEDASLAGLVHDITVQLESIEPDWYDLPEEPDVPELVEEAVTGEKKLPFKGSGRSALQERKDELVEKYGIDPGNFLEETFYGVKVGEALDQVGRYRSDVWRDDWGDLRRHGLLIKNQPIETEKYLSDSQLDLTGKADLIIHRKEGDELREIKIRSNDDYPTREDEYQVSAYKLLGDDVEEVTLEYPLQSEILEEDEFRKSPDDWHDIILEDKKDLSALVDRFLDFQEKKLEHTLERSTGISRKDEEDIRSYRDRTLNELSKEEVREISKHSTEEAINNLENELASIDALIKELEAEYKPLQEIYQSWKDRTGRRVNYPLWDNLTDLYDAGIIEKKDIGEETHVKVRDEFRDSKTENILQKINEIEDEYTPDEVYKVSRNYESEVDLEILKDHFERDEWDIILSEEELNAVKENWKGDKEFIVNLKNGKEGLEFSANAVYKSRSENQNTRGFFAPKHEKNYLETKLVDRINTLVQRNDILDEAVDKAFNSLEEDEKYLDQVKKHLEYVSNSKGSLDSLIDKTVNAYYEPGILENGFKANKIIMPYSEKVESSLVDMGVGEDILPLGDALKSTKEGKLSKKKGKTYLRSYLNELIQMAESRDYEDLSKH